MGNKGFKYPGKLGALQRSGGNWEAGEGGAWTDCDSTPPSRDGTGRPRKIRMASMKVLDESRVDDVTGRDP